QPGHFRIAMAALDLVSEVATDAPLLLVVEDAHWLDQPPADGRAPVARRSEADPIVLPAAIRRGDPSPLAGPVPGPAVAGPGAPPICGRFAAGPRSAARPSARALAGRGVAASTRRGRACPPTGRPEARGIARRCCPASTRRSRANWRGRARVPGGGERSLSQWP